MAVEIHGIPRSFSIARNVRERMGLFVVIRIDVPSELLEQSVRCLVLFLILVS